MSSLETVSALQRRLNTSIPQQTVRGKVAERLKQIGRTAKIAGFRPGKVPHKILDQYYGGQARQEAVGEALQRAFAQEVEALGLKIAGNPEFDLKTGDLDAEVIEYSATFEVYPEVVLGDVAAEAVTRVTFTLSQGDVDSTVETMRKQRATYEAVNRPAQNDDKVMIDFVGKLNGEVFQGGEAKDYPVTVGSGRMLPEFEAAIAGMSVGEEKSFNMTFPEDYHGKDVAGKEVTFTITLKSVEAPVLPAVDAEFAKSVGVADGDVAKLIEEIRSNLSREVERRLKSRNKEAAMDVLVKVCEFDLPRALVGWEMESLMQQTVRDMEQRGMKMNGMQLPPELFRERAEKRVKLGLILNYLVEKHDLGAQADKLRALVEDYAQSFDQPEEVVRWYYADPARLQEIENLVLEENVADWVMANAKVTDQPVTFTELMGN
ncbi:MAG: trigger factor [Gallionella sp.]|nr:trigger factor [Gallionella sp.]MDD4947362.1 trigger factor [Gallionella sp.]MDD5612851.1 trigger factor [Gallionella sp.]